MITITRCKLELCVVYTMIDNDDRNSVVIKDICYGVDMQTVHWR